MNTPQTHQLFTLDDVLSPAECAAMIRRAEAAEFQPATINTVGGVRQAADIRNNERVIFDDPALAAELWPRVRPRIPAYRAGREYRGLNERFRFYRYGPGQKFDWHYDAPYERDNGDMSLLTFMIYLNEGYEGGETDFGFTAVRGRTGMALVFKHALDHRGAEVSRGLKYVLRTDVMFGPVGRFSG